MINTYLFKALTAFQIIVGIVLGFSYFHFFFRTTQDNIPPELQTQTIQLLNSSISDLNPSKQYLIRGIHNLMESFYYQSLAFKWFMLATILCLVVGPLVNLFLFHRIIKRTKT